MMDEEASASLLLKIKPWLEGGGPFRQGGGARASVPEASVPEAEASFSALDLRDRVVIVLLREHVVRVDQVEAAWKRWKSEQADTPDALWRVVARLPEVDAEAVFAAAARVYAFEPATALLPRGPAFLRAHREHFSRLQRRRLAALGLLPVGIDETSGQRCWVFATHDPARSAVHALLGSLQVAAYELRYAPAAAVRVQLENAFPENAFPGNAFPGGAATDAPSSKAPRKKLRGSETARTFASIYEELIAGVARSGASRVRLAAAPQGQASLVVTFDYDERDEHRRVELKVPPEAVLSFMHRRVRSARRSRAAEGQQVHRWVAGRRHSFRIAALPARTAWTNGGGEIVIEAAG